MRLTLISTPIGYLGSGKGGGVELTLSSLVSGLLKQGHFVDVVAPENSKLSKSCHGAKLVCVDGENQESWQHRDYYSPISIPERSIVTRMWEKAERLGKSSDIILNLSYDWLPISKTLNSDTPIAHLISMGDESFEIKNIISKVHSYYPLNFAFHSQIQASDYSFIKHPIIVGNGFELSKYQFRNHKNGPLAWVGRVAPEKGLEDAVYVASELGETLQVWGIIEDKDYAAKIESRYPLGAISWKGFLETHKLQEELGLCRVLINTPKWNEAYGNVVVEAMACGVPVVAYNKGGPGEIINHGITGYLTEPDDKESLVSFVKDISSIEREKCRDWVEENASSLIFADKIVSWLGTVINSFKKQLSTQ